MFCKSLFFVVLFIRTSKSEETLQPLIHNGIPAQEGSFPYQVSIRYKISDWHLCGGAIIAEQWIATAKHCIEESQPGDLQIYVGSIYKDHGGVYYDIERLIPYPGDYWILEQDFGLIQVNEKIRFNDFTQPISIAAEYWDFQPDDRVNVSGWGVNEKQESPNQLHYTETFLDYSIICLIIFPLYANDAIVCTQKFQPGNACYGDSGGPLVRKGKLVGVVSGGWKCSTGYHSVYSKVHYYQNWINSQMQRFSKP
ncbi:chymotrypsin-1-like [Culicoides brevitarsis]|uniref:chymotrypsin-1-like n=1 Tax=Culicoides brevitarsis TaxID=469753 RepID=UPI00307C1C92